MTGVLGPETQRRIDMIFSVGDRDEAARLLCASTLSDDRVWISALKLSNGNLEKLKEAIAVGENDFRDLLYSAGFANDRKKHLRWIPGQIAKSWWAALMDRFRG